MPEHWRGVDGLDLLDGQTGRDSRQSPRGPEVVYLDRWSGQDQALPLAVLHLHCDLDVTTRSQLAQESAEKMAIKLLFPMILFVFPPAVMVMVGPAFISLSHALRGF